MIKLKSHELTIGTVAALFRVTRWTVYNWIKQGQMASIRYSDRRQLISKDEVMRFYHDKNCNFDLQDRLQKVIG